MNMKKAWKSLRKSIKGKEEPQGPLAPEQGTQDLTGRTPQDLEGSNNNETAYTNGILRSSYTKTNESGRKVTATTVRVPAGYTATADPNPVVPPKSPSQDASEQTRDQTRELVKRFIADIWNRGEIDLIPEVCSPNLRLNGNTGFDRVGHDGLARMVSIIRDALSDYHCEIHSMVVEHNKAFCRLRFTGKHTGTLMNYEATGRVVAWMGATEFTCQNGRILKVWELGDVKSLEEQLKTATEEGGEI